MITITVTSEIMQATRFFKKDGPSVTYLKRVKKLHRSVAERAAGEKPTRRQYPSSKTYKAALEVWEANVCGTPLKIDICCSPRLNLN